MSFLIFCNGMIILGLFARDSLGEDLANILFFGGVFMGCLRVMAIGLKDVVTPESRPVTPKPTSQKPKARTPKAKPSFTPPEPTPRRPTSSYTPLKSTTTENSYTHLAGFPHRFGKNTKPSSILKPGDHLFAEREPTNKHDPNAIRLHDKAGRFVGFVAKNDNHDYAASMDKGMKLDVRVIRVNDSQPWRGISLEIKMSSLY